MLYKITHILVAIDPNLYLVKQPIMHTRNSNILQYQLFNKVWGDQIEEQYSRFDFTMDLYARLLVYSCLIYKFLCKKLKILLAFAVMLLMCVSHDILLDNVILVFINDLPASVSSKARLFADDCILYRTIENHQDCVTLQMDLNKT
jgi:hypothetical protein